MRANGLMRVGAVVVALSVSGYAAEAGQRDSKGRDRNGRSSQGQVQRDGGARQESGGPRQESVVPPPAERAQAERAQPVDPAPGGTAQRRYAIPRSAAPAPAPVPPAVRNNGSTYDSRGYSHPGYQHRPSYSHGYPGYRYQPYPYAYRGYGYAPRVVVPAYYPRHYYGPGGNFSVYFGSGNGYLYGAPWTGRVYGYVAPPVYGTRVYYGDVRLLVQPRDAAVYVDGYYAGIVDDFDGTFQRLTLTSGPHQLELSAPGLESRFFDVYVDPSHTVDIHADLFR